VLFGAEAAPDGPSMAQALANAENQVIAVCIMNDGVASQRRRRRLQFAKQMVLPTQRGSRWLQFVKRMI
jgi:hypothetical protein